MPTLKLRKADGSEAGALSLDDAVFGVEPNPHVVRAVVSQQLANRRQGTHSTKTRAYVSGGGRKPYKQKGTGRARQGSIRATQWRGGATVFGPQPRGYTKKVNAKVRQAAFRSIFSELVATERLIVVDGFNLDSPKTRQVVETLDKLGVNVRADSVLIVKEGADANLELSARNIPTVTLLNRNNLNAFDLLTHDWVVLTHDVARQLEETYAV